MDQILTSIRTLLLDHLAAIEALTSNVALGGATVKIANTSRFRVGDEAYLLSNVANKAETVNIIDIPDDKTITLSQGSVRGWTVAETSYIQKAVNHQFIKRIHIGDLKIIPSFPTITIDVASESNEWLTLKQTAHDYKFNIRTYVLADGFETTNIFLIKLTQQIREILIDHIRPIIDGESHLLTLDLPVNTTVVTIGDTSNFAAGDWVFIRDAFPRPAQQEVMIKKILSPTQVELTVPICYDFLVSRQGEMILVKRLLYDSRPDAINYGYVVSEGGGTLMRASEISFFAKENIYRSGPINT